jgi:hypothetical protein
MAQASRRALRGRGPDPARRPGHAARSGTQDRQRGAQRGVRPARVAGRHPRRAAVPPARADRRDDPVKVEQDSTTWCRAAERGRFSLRADPARPSGLRGTAPPLRGVRAGRPSAPRPESRGVQNGRGRAPEVELENLTLRSTMGPPTRFPPPGLRAMPGSAAWRRCERRPLLGAVAAFSARLRRRSARFTARCTWRIRARRRARLVELGQQVVARRALSSGRPIATMRCSTS